MPSSPRIRVVLVSGVCLLLLLGFLVEDVKSSSSPSQDVEKKPTSPQKQSPKSPLDSMRAAFQSQKILQIFQNIKQEIEKIMKLMMPAAGGGSSGDGGGGGAKGKLEEDDDEQPEHR